MVVLVEEVEGGLMRFVEEEEEEAIQVDKVGVLMCF
jgi:preprotein translocase subunit Sec61beta